MDDRQSNALLDLLTAEIRAGLDRLRAAGATPDEIEATIAGRRRALVELAAAHNEGEPMRTKTALQLADGSGWHYVNASRDGGYPIGACAEHPPHATEDEARECYGAWVRDNTIRLNAGTSSWTSCQHRENGERCPDPTREYATYGDDGYGQVALCPQHMTVENVIAAAQLGGPAGDAWIS